MFSWADTSNCLSEHREQWQQCKRGSVNSRCHSVCWPATTRQALQTSINGHSCHGARSSTPAGTDVDAEVLSYISACQHARLMSEMTAWHFGIQHQLIPITGTISTRFTCCTGITGLCGTCFSVCGDLTAGKRTRLCKKLANRTFLKMNNTFYDWLIWPSNIMLRNTYIYNWNWNWKTTTEITLSISMIWAYKSALVSSTTSNLAKSKQIARQRHCWSAAQLHENPPSQKASRR